MCVFCVCVRVCVCVCVSSCLISFRDKDLDFSLKDFPPEASEVVLAFVTLSHFPCPTFARHRSTLSSRHHATCETPCYFLPCPVLQPFDRWNFGKVVEVECSSIPTCPRDLRKHNPVGHTALGSGNLLLNYCCFFCRCRDSLLHQLTCVFHRRGTHKFLTLFFCLLPQKPFALAPELCKIWSTCYHSEFTPATAAAIKDFSDDISSFLPR